VILLTNYAVRGSFISVDDSDIIINNKMSDVTLMAAIGSKTDVNDLHLGEKDERQALVAKLPKSAREIYQLLQTNGALKPKEIGLYTTLSHRTIRYGLKILVDEGLSRRIPDLHDLRTHFYAIN
jgi:hypothetical protein